MERGREIRTFILSAMANDGLRLLIRLGCLRMSSQFGYRGIVFDAIESTPLTNFTSVRRSRRRDDYIAWHKAT